MNREDADGVSEWQDNLGVVVGGVLTSLTAGCIER